MSATKVPDSLIAQPLTAGTAQATTSGTSKDFTDIPSWVKRITVAFAGVSTNGTSLLQLQLGSSGGLKTTGYVGGAWYHNTTAISAGNHTTGLALVGTVSAAGTYNGIATLFHIGNNVWVGSVAVEHNALGGGGSMSVTLDGTLDRLRLTTVNGTDAFDAGSFNIFYE